MPILLFLLCLAVFFCIGILWRAQKTHHSAITLHPFLPHENPSHILVGDKPPLLGGTLKAIPLETFEKKENIRWFNSPLTYLGTLDFIAKQVGAPDEEPIICNFNDFAICEINPEVGKGIFATKPIKANTIIGIYAGTLNISYGQQNGQYILISYADNKNIAYYDAEYYRNMTSYVQHAPTKTDLHIASANIDTKIFIQKGVPVTFYVTTRDISAYEQILFDYGEFYTFEKPFKYFDRRGVVLPQKAPV